MSDNIVKRLRDKKDADWKKDAPHAVIAAYEKERGEAANEIKRLSAEVKRLSEIYDSGYIDGYDDARENNVDEIERLRAEIARQREVLEQYACSCSSPCWYPKDSASCGLNAKRATE